MKYLVIHSRWIRSSTQSGEFIVDQSARKREAQGLARHNFKSTMQMLIKHQYDAEDWEIDEDRLSISLADVDGLWYHSRFFVLESNND